MPLFLHPPPSVSLSKKEGCQLHTHAHPGTRTHAHTHTHTHRHLTTGEEATPIVRFRHPGAGHAVLHRGRQLHEVLQVTRGNRYGLIVWCLIPQPYSLIPNPLIPNPKSLMHDAQSIIPHPATRSPRPRLSPESLYFASVSRWRESLFRLCLSPLSLASVSPPQGCLHWCRDREGGRERRGRQAGR